MFVHKLCLMFNVFYTNQNNFTDGYVRGYIKNPVYRFVANEHKYNRSAGFSTTDDNDPSITSCWRKSVDNLVHSQYVNLVLM